MPKETDAPEPRPEEELTAPIDVGWGTPSGAHDLRELDREQIKQVLERLASEPLRLRTDNLVPRPWGGHRLVSYKGLEGAARPGRYGESFEIAAYPHDPEAARYPSVVEFADGSSMRLSELLGRAGETVLGADFFQAFGSSIPLLPKFLDIEALLSVQSHPAGKPEAYVIIDCDPGATIRVGFARELDPLGFAARLEAGRAAQEQIGELFWVGERDYGPILAELLGKPDAVARLAERLVPMLSRAEDRPRLLELLTTLDACYCETLADLNLIHVAPGMVVFNADPPGARSEELPSAQVHCLGNPERRSILLLELRRPGATYRAWDHVRFPLRELAIDEAIASMSFVPTRPEDFIVEPHELPGRPGVLRSVECPAFVIDHLCPRPGISVPALTEGLPSTLHAIRGAARLFGPGERRWGTLRAGESLLLPAGVTSLRLEGQTPDTELVQVTIPLPEPSARAPGELAPGEARHDNLVQMRGVVAQNEGVAQLLAIVNGGDGPRLRARLAELAPAIFRADGHTQIHAHEEPVRRGQLLGLLDALRAHAGLDPKRVALGIMLPGKGTRLSPLTARLHGIKPLFPVPVQAQGPRGPVWLDAAAASLWCWTLVAWSLERQGFRGVAWKWGDEVQIAARRLTALDHDLADVDAVRFGARAKLSEDLARNKEWLLADPDTAELFTQLRRRPLAELRAQIEAAERDHRGELERYVHTGSPAFSHLFLRHAQQVFAGCEGWIDVDGYLFEALTHDDRAWAALTEADAGLRALLERCPDFRARVVELRRRIEAERGHPMRIVVLDFGAEPYWGDVGQLDKARAMWSALAVEGEPGEFARALAGLAAAERDPHGNLLVGDARVPDDGSVRGCVLIDSQIDRGHASGAVIVRSSLGLAMLEPGAVVIDSRVDGLRLGTGSLAFASVGEYLRVPAGFVHTSIVDDPHAESPRLESWFADMSADPGAESNYTQPRWGNPGSFADKFAQMRQREVDPATIEARVRALGGAHGAKGVGAGE